MKSARPLLIAAGVVVVLIALAVGIAMLPSVQRWAVLRAVEGQPDLDLTLDRVAVGPRHFSASGVVVRRDGIEARIGHVEGDYSLWDFLARRRVSIGSLAANDVVVDAQALGTAATTAGAVAAPAAAPGVLAHAELPYEIVLGRIEVVGRALLPRGPAKASSFPAEFTLSGGGIAPGKEGTLQLTAVVANDSPDARVTTLRANMSVQIAQTHERSVDRAAITLVIDAEGPQFADQNQLRVNAEMSRRAGAEKYSASIDTLLGSDTDHLLSVAATLPDGGAEMVGSWSLQVRDAQIAPFFLGGALPKFAAEGAGTFAVRHETGGVTLAGRLRSEAQGLEVAAPELRAIGPVIFETEFDLAREGHVLRVQKLRARLDGEQPVLNLETERAIAVDVSTWRFDVGAGSTEAHIARLSIAALPVAWVRPFVSGLDVSGGVISGDFGVTSGRAGIEIASLAPLRATQLTIVREGKVAVDRADVSAKLDARIGADAVHAHIAELALQTLGGDRLAGDIEAQFPLRQDGRTAARGTLEIFKNTSAGSLAALAANLSLKVSGDVSVGDERLDVKSFVAELHDRERDRVLLSARTSTWSLDLDTFSLIENAPGTELGRITFGPWPLAMFGPLITVGELSGELSGGTMLLTAADKGLRLHAPDPIKIANLSLRKGGRVVLDRVSFELAPEISYIGAANWKLAVPSFVLRGATGAQLATLGADGSADAVKGVRANASFDVDLPAMSVQPLFAGAHALTAGRASGELRAALGQELQVEARATLNGLVARDPAVKLPVANLSFRGVRDAAGRMTIDAPLLLDRLGQRSEIRVTAEAQKPGDTLEFKGKLTGDRVDLPDALGVLALFGAPVESIGAPAGVAPARPATVMPDEKPFWSGVAGELTLDVRSLTNGPDWLVADIRGFVDVQADRLVFRDIAATINERSRYTAGGGASFSAGAHPYKVGAEFSLTEFDLGAFLKSFEPERPPVVEGLFTVAGRFGGSGATFGHALDQARGQFHLTGGKGIFRGLKRATEKVSVASRAVEALGSLFGSSKVKETAEKVAGQAYQVDQLAQALGEFEFDQLVLRTVRDESLDVKIEELSLISPEVRLVGNGLVSYQPGVPVIDQPLNLTYAISAQGKVEKLLEKLKVLDGGKDELGYATTKEKGVISGTLAKPDASSYFIKLAGSKLTDFLIPD